MGAKLCFIQQYALEVLVRWELASHGMVLHGEVLSKQGDPVILLLAVYRRGIAGVIVPGAVVAGTVCQLQPVHHPTGCNTELCHFSYTRWLSTALPIVQFSISITSSASLAFNLILDGLPWKHMHTFYKRFLKSHPICFLSLILFRLVPMWESRDTETVQTGNVLFITLLWCATLP